MLQAQLKRGRWETYRCGVLSVPVMDVVHVAVQLQNDVRVALVELSVEFGVLSNRFELFDAVHLKRVLASLREESLSLRTHRLNVFVHVCSVESFISVFSLDHFAIVV
jgi:hypothetical protein